MINQITFNAPRWSPSELNSEAWFDAKDQSTLTLRDNLYVSQWRDKSGKNRHATQTIESRQPAFLINNNAFPYVANFGDSATGIGTSTLVIQNRSGLLQNVGGATIVMLVEYSTPAIGYVWPTESIAAFVSTGTNPTNVRFGINASHGIPINKTVAIVAHRVDSSSQSFTQAVAGRNPEFYPSLYVSSYDYVGSLGTGLFNNWVNGTQTAINLTGASSGTTSNTTPLNAGLFGIDGTTQTRCILGGSRIYEFLMFNSTLTIENRQKIEGYLLWKWFDTGGWLPIGHPYRDVPP